MKRILCYGDSNTHGANPNWMPTLPESEEVPVRWGADVRWPKLLQEMLGSAEYEVIEEGLCGRTTVYRDHAWPWCCGRDYAKPCILSHNPLDLIILMLGTNDLKAGSAASEDACMLAMDELLKTILNPFLYEGFPTPKVLLVSPIAIGDNLEHSFMYGTFTEKSRELSLALPKLYSILAKKYNCAFLAASDYAKASRADSIHMDAENHRKLAQAMAAKVREILA